MPNEDRSDTPSSNAQTKPLAQPPMLPAAPKQDEVGKNTKCCTNNEESKTTKLELAIKAGEICLIIINALLLITTIVIACIYYGQLQEMRKATEATGRSADAAKVAADTAADSAKLNRQLAEGTQRAFISFDVQTGSYHPGQFEFTISFDNTGHIASPKFTADVTVTKETLVKGIPIGKPIRWTIPITPVRTDENGPRKKLDIEFSVEAANRFEQTIRVEAEGWYDNGFDTKVPINFCKRYVSDVINRNAGFIWCQDVDAYLRRAMDASRAAEADKKQQAPQPPK